MASTDSRTLEGITFDYEKDGVQVRRQIAKKLLNMSGSWADIGVKHQNLNHSTGEFKEPKITLTRFRRTDGIWKKQNGYNVNSKEQAEAIVSFLRDIFDLE